MGVGSMLDIAVDWAKRSFGAEQMKNPGTRSLRIVEEAIELCQAVGVPQSKVDLCVSEVYSRPPGDPTQEIGGVLMTVYLFVRALGWMYSGDRPSYYFVKELRRVLSKTPKHFADRNADKIAAGLEVPHMTSADYKRESIGDGDAAGLEGGLVRDF